MSVNSIENCAYALPLRDSKVEGFDVQSCQDGVRLDVNGIEPVDQLY